MKFECDQDVQSQMKERSVGSGTQSFAWGALISAQDQNFLSSLSNALPPYFLPV